MKKIIEVHAKENYELIVDFETGEKKSCNILQFLDKGDFQELKDMEIFKQVKNLIYSVEWPNEVDLSSDTLDAIGMRI
jgi:hypothetical protein